MADLTWVGKEEIESHHQRIEYKSIECKETVGDSETENLIIEGDNLLALSQDLRLKIT